MNCLLAHWVLDGGYRDGVDEAAVKYYDGIMAMMKISDSLLEAIAEDQPRANGRGYMVIRRQDRICLFCDYRGKKRKRFRSVD